jgi:hypothetical protein
MSYIGHVITHHMLLLDVVLSNNFVNVLRELIWVLTVF